MTIPTPLAERFWKKVERGEHEDDCWEWVGARHHRRGYGQIWIGPAPYRPGYKAAIDYVHHVALFLAGIPIPDGHEVHHTCENRRCVNPAHLEVMTAHHHFSRHPEHPWRVNADQWATGECAQGHELTETNIGIRTDGRRYCRECRRVSATKSYQRRKLNAV